MSKGKVVFSYHMTKEANRPPAPIRLDTVAEALGAAWDMHRGGERPLIGIMKDGQLIYDSDALCRAVERMSNREAAAHIAKEDGYE
jgi:hypothetical protein